MLLTNIFSIYRKTRFNLTETKAKKLEFKPGLYKFALLTVYNIDAELDEFKLKVKQLLRNSFTIIINTPKLPNKPIIKEEIIYLITEPRYMGAICFKDYSNFSFVCGVGKDGKVEARRVASMKNIPFIKNTLTPRYGKTIDIKKKLTNKILFDTNHEASGRGLGDILMSTAIIKKIKTENPQSKLIYTTRPIAKPILRNNPYIDELKAEDYIKNDFINKLDNYDKHYFLGKMTENYTVTRNRQPRIDSMAELFDIELNDKTPEIYLTQEELETNKKYIDNKKINIVFSREAISAERRYSKEKLITILDYLKNKKKYNLIVVGQQKEDYSNNIVNLTGKQNLRELFSIIALSDFVVTTDNFVSHIAGAFRIPEIILYTNIPAEWRCKYYKKAIPIKSNLKCSPCWNRYKNTDRKCLNNYQCINDFDPKDLITLIENNAKKKPKKIESLFPKIEIPKNIKIKENEKLNNSGIIFISLWRRMGDCLFGIPTIRELRKKYYNKKIIWATHYQFKDIVKNCPYIDAYLLFQGRVDDGWDEYLPNPDNQIIKLCKQLQPEKIYNLHISPVYNNELKKNNYNIIEFVGKKLANLKDMDIKLKYFPNKKKYIKVKRIINKLKKGYKGLITYNAGCYSPTPAGMWDKESFGKLLTLFERAGYKTLNIGHLTDKPSLIRENFLYPSLDYLYYALKLSNLFIGYDSGIRNLALTADTKIISIENNMAYENKSDIKSLSNKDYHIGVDMHKEKPRDIFLKGMSLLNKQEYMIKEFDDILKNQFIRRR